MFCFESRPDGNPFDSGFKGLTAKFFRFWPYNQVSVHFIGRPWRVVYSRAQVMFSGF
ncbi:hypothetical protein VCR26J2_180017 [Vibrio coralliirubri]|nr:hypothetical protein VCR26J2_180017 [Vibrio coralliirubri]CDT99750.1 hypothetical protein VCR8J2_60183 [Vibrio coralliirubri]